MSRARVCHVITQLELGGAQQNTLFTVSHLDRDRFEPSLVAGPGGLLDAEARRLADTPVRFVPALGRRVSPASDLGALGAIRKELRALRPDIVHTHSSKAGILGRWAAHLEGVPVVIHSIHGFGFHPGQTLPVRAAFQAAERMTGPITTHFIAVSRSNREQGIALGLFRERKATLIRSGVELDRFRRAGLPEAEALRRELGIPSAAPLVGMIACLKPQKSAVDFVRAAGLLAGEFPEARFVIAGDGEQRRIVEGAIARAGLGARFHLLGWRRDVPAIVAGLDVCVLTSRWEGLPRVIPEAMAAGKPVVATRVDGSAEAVREGVTGFLCEPGDARTIAARIGALLADPGRARAMGAAARPLAGEWDIREMVRAQESLYGRLLDRAGLGS